VAAIGLLLARQGIGAIFTFLVLLLCIFGILMAIQMAIVLGRFSAQNRLWEWQLRGIEQAPSWTHRRVFTELHQFRDRRTALQDPGNEPRVFEPNWAIRQHRQWWARRELSFPYFFGSVYAVLFIWAISQLLG
jgi:hypothetical protein